MKNKKAKQEIISAIDENPAGVNGFKEDDLLNFLASEYDEDNWKSQLDNDIQQYRAEIERLNSAQSYSQYGSQTLIAVLACLGLANNTANSQPNANQGIGYAVPQIFLAVSLMLIKAVTDPWKERDDKVLKRLLAIEQCALNKNIPHKKNWVEEKIDSGGATTNPSNAAVSSLTESASPTELARNSPAGLACSNLSMFAASVPSANSAVAAPSVNNQDASNSPSTNEDSHIISFSS